MGYLNNYLKYIIKKGKKQLAKSIENTVNTVAPQYLENFSFCEHKIGLLFGNVQSGKTGQMFGIICAATDLGFPVFLILTTDNVTLQQQTIERVRKDLSDFCICDEYDSEIFTENQLMKPVIIVLKKNIRTLKQWTNIFASTGFMKGNPLFIVDDEADAASLNTMINYNKQSSINRYLEEIKNKSSCSIYLQVTGTPQALLLQSITSGWHPYFSCYFSPGNSYLGGDFFFKIPKPNCIAIINNIKQPLFEAILRHLIVSAQIFSNRGTVCNFLIHPSVRKDIHTKYKKEVEDALAQITESLQTEHIKEKLHLIYNELSPRQTILSDFEVLYKKIYSILNEIKIIIMNGDATFSNIDYSSGCNIIIGGNTLGRGVTFPCLQTIYYTRTAKHPQADTMWQHSRMFGYDRDAGLMKIYIDEHLYKLFADINATNNSIIAQITKNTQQIKIYYPEELKPTRKNVLDKKKISVLSGGTNYYPFNPNNLSIEKLDTLLKDFNDEHPLYTVNLRFIKELLQYIISDDDFRIKSFISIIDMMIAETPTKQGNLIVRRNRNIAKGTGAMLSPNDWKLGASITDNVILTMYKMTGEKGWNGQKLWVPNIKLPDNIIYYDIIDGMEAI